MSHDNQCIVCNKLVDGMNQGIFTESIYRLTGKFVCSNNCQFEFLGKLVLSIGGITTIIGLFLMFLTSSMFWVGVFLLGFALIVLGSYLMSLNKPRRSTNLQKVNRARMLYDSKNTQKLTNSEDPQDQLIYSNIVDKIVLPCCHQSARLNDKYCACGRVIEYPVEN